MPAIVNLKQCREKI